MGAGGKMNSRGSHVGFIISFLVFVTFVSFLYTLIAPDLRTRASQEYFVSSVEEKLLDEISGNYLSLTLQNEREQQKSCVSFSSDTLGVSLSDYTTVRSQNILVPDDSEPEEVNGEPKKGDDASSPEAERDNFNKGRGKGRNTRSAGQASLEGESLFIGYSANLNAYKVILSDFSLEEFPLEDTDDCSPQEEPSLTISSEQHPSLDGAYLLVENYGELYSAQYRLLKEKLGIPSSVNFGFSVLSSDRVPLVLIQDDVPFNLSTREEEQAKQVQGEVFSRETPIQYMNRTADLNNGYFVVRVW